MRTSTRQILNARYETKKQEIYVLIPPHSPRVAGTSFYAQTGCRTFSDQPFWSLVVPESLPLGQNLANSWANLRSSASPDGAGRSKLVQQSVQLSLMRSLAAFVSTLTLLVLLSGWKSQSKGQRNQSQNFNWF